MCTLSVKAEEILESYVENSELGFFALSDDLDEQKICVECGNMSRTAKRKCTCGNRLVNAGKVYHSEVRAH